jgi:hypothetical protein
MNENLPTCGTCYFFKLLNGVEGHCIYLDIYKRCEDKQCSPDIFRPQQPRVTKVGDVFKAIDKVNKGDLCVMTNDTNTCTKPDLTEGVKFDDKKLRVDLVPPEVVLAVSQILTHGARKYDDTNWKKGIAFNRVYRAALTHLYAYMLGDEQDKDSGLPHLWHSLCNLVFLVYYDYHHEKYKEFDNRPCAERKKMPNITVERLLKFIGDEVDG